MLASSAEYQSQTFRCTFNAADGPQSLIVAPEAGEKVPHQEGGD